MGEIAESMLDGTLCEACGEYIGSDSGYPNYCSESCANDRGMTLVDGVPVSIEEKRPPKAACPRCGKKCRGEQGVRDHLRVKHGAA
jgi:hypothetical protein